MSDVVRAYATDAARYIQALGDATTAPTAERNLILDWATSVSGPILDVGCGPGRWTAFLHERGFDVTGIDPVSEFIADARVRFPEIPFETGWAEHLEAPDQSIGGILSWYALIHTAPENIDAVFAEFARVLKPGGSLLVSFFAGHEVTAFEHPVTTAWLWTVPDLTDRFDRAGFTVLTAIGNTGPEPVSHGTVIATRR